jgi:hypothetical protein
LIGQFDLDPNRVFDIVSIHSSCPIHLPLIVLFCCSVVLTELVEHMEMACKQRLMLAPILSMVQVLECFELQPENTTFLELIPLFPKVCGVKWSFWS